MNEQKCSTVTDTVNEKKCDTVNEEKCDTVNERKCEKVSRQKCDTVVEKQCKNVQDQVPVLTLIRTISNISFRAAPTYASWQCCTRLKNLAATKD